MAQAVVEEWLERKRRGFYQNLGFARALKLVHVLTLSVYGNEENRGRVEGVLNVDVNVF